MLLEGEEGLANYSAKFAAMLERIRDAPGSSLVYSQFLSMEGVGIFRVAMNVNGYAPIEMVATGAGLSFTKATEESLRLGPGKQPRYITFSGVEDEAVRAAALSIFNAQFSELPESMNALLKEAGYTDNKVGELCRVFCITSAGAEGLSLRNVRAVHIMEPYWNKVRTDQVKGRAVRICSHADLPYDEDPAKNERVVEVFTYISKFSDAQKSSRRVNETLVNKDKAISTDESIFSVARDKKKLAESLFGAMREAAVDCVNNATENGQVTCYRLENRIDMEPLYEPDLDKDVAVSAASMGRTAPVGKV
jgi:hypothetical protein